MTLLPCRSLPSSLVKAVEKKEGGGAHNWGRLDDLDPG